jgi:hypothetical protein
MKKMEQQTAGGILALIPVGMAIFTGLRGDPNLTAWAAGAIVFLGGCYLALTAKEPQEAAA